MKFEELKALAKEIPPGRWDGLVAYTDFAVGLSDRLVHKELSDPAGKAVATLAALATPLLALVEAEIGMKYANGVWTGAKILEERLDVFLAELAKLEAP